MSEIGENGEFLSGFWVNFIEFLEDCEGISEISRKIGML